MVKLLWSTSSSTSLLTSHIFLMICLIILRVVILIMHIILLYLMIIFIVILLLLWLILLMMRRIISIVVRSTSCLVVIPVVVHLCICRLRSVFWFLVDLRNILKLMRWLLANILVMIIEMIIYRIWLQKPSSTFCSSSSTITSLSPSFFCLILLGWVLLLLAREKLWLILVLNYLTILVVLRLWAKLWLILLLYNWSLNIWSCLLCSSFTL